MKIRIALISLVMLMCSSAYSATGQLLRAPDRPIDEHEIELYLGVSQMTICLGTQVPEGYAITQYQSSPACGFIPGVPGIELLLENTEGIYRFHACATSPYPDGYVIIANLLIEECKLNAASMGLAHIFQSVSSLEEENRNPDSPVLQVCSNSQHPPGYHIFYKSFRDDCSIDSNDSILEALYVKTIDEEVIACAYGPRPSKDYVVVGKDPEPCGSTYGNDERIDLGARYIYRKPQGEPVLRVCIGLDPTPPAGYILTGIEEDEECRPDIVAPYEFDPARQDFYTDFGIKGYAHIYKLPFYALFQ